MTYDRKEQRPEIPRNSGDFRDDGGWNPAAQAAHRGRRFRFVENLIRARLAARISPARLTEQIEASDFAGMFGGLGHWQTLERWDDWPFASTRTVADSAVKYCGTGSPEFGHWQGGAFVHGRDERHHVHADPDRIAEFVAGLTRL